MDGQTSTRRSRHVTIVGGGIVGLLCAMRLLRLGCQVRIVDHGLAERRCSYGNAGSLSPGSVAPLGMPGVLRQVPRWLVDRSAPLHVSYDYWLRLLPWLLQFLRASTPRRVEEISLGLRSLLSSSIDRYVELLTEVRGLDLLRRTGQLQLYSSSEAFRKDCQAWQLRRKRGVVAETVHADEIRQLEPAVSRRYACGVFLPNEGLIVHPARLLELLAEHIVRNGGEIRTAEVLGFDLGHGMVTALVLNGGRIGVDQVVIAAGAWSNMLTRQLGEHFPLQTQRGYHVTLAKPGVELNRPVVAADRKYFASPMEHGLRIAGTVEFADLSAPPNFARAQTILAAARELLPDLDTTGGIEWMGNRPCLPDSLPILDRARHFRNVFYAFGNGHLGLTAAPMMGELAASLVSGGEPTVDISPFAARRFF
jgi:glycine/D-amino acid oxidase-like deaminating enzyme